MALRKTFGRLLSGNTAETKDKRKRGGDAAYHEKHRQQALKKLAALSEDGRDLLPAHRRQCDDYAREVLGDAVFAPWLHVYAAMQGRFVEGWIPDNYFGRIVVPRTSGEYGRLCMRKGIAARLFSTDLLPGLGFWVNNRFVTQDMQVLPRQEVADHLFAGRARVIYKREFSGQGRGVEFVDRAGFEAGFLDRCGEGEFQEVIRQHESFARFCPGGAVATLRVTTLVAPDGEVEVRASHMRLGSGQDSHVMLKSQVTVAVDRSSGALDETGYLPDWKRCARHPDSDAPFAGTQVPGLKALTAQLCALHGALPFVQAIGWDVAFDEAGAPRILEWNGGHVGIVFSEAVTGPCYADLGWQHLWKVPRPDRQRSK